MTDKAEKPEKGEETLEEIQAKIDALEAKKRKVAVPFQEFPKAIEVPLPEPSDKPRVKTHTVIVNSPEEEKAALEKHKVRRVAEAETAVGVFVQAAELAPVFGMAGTLVALSRLAATDLSAEGAITAAIALSVVTTLYGILLANLLLAPIARLIERAAAREEAARQEVVDWLAAQVAQAMPRRKSVSAQHHALEQAYGSEAA